MPFEAMPPKKELVEIAARAKGCDPEAFSQLFDLFFERMRRYVYYHTGSLDTADELASEVFASALESIDNFQDRGGTIGHWLYGIARNLLSEHYRTEGKAVREKLELAKAVWDGSDPESQVLAVLDYEDIFRALDRLPDDQREVVVLRFIEGYRVGEIASILGKTPGAVRAQQHRALISLRRMFVPEVGTR
jgi:RNA polymerase sigma-70 factor, ECF subfamily